MKAYVEDTVSIQSVILGKAVDLEGDAISQSFTCVTCAEGAQILYNEVDGIVTIAPDTPAGTYLIELILSDDNEDGQSEKLSFKIEVHEPFVLAPVTTSEEDD